MRKTVSVAFLAVWVVLAAPLVHATQASDRAKAELELLTALYSLERLANQMNHILVYAVTAERGGWRALGTGIGNDYAIASNANNVDQQLDRLNARIRSNPSVSDAALADMIEVINAIDLLTTLGPEITDLMRARAFDEAIELYRLAGQPAYHTAIRGAHGAIYSVERRLAKALEAEAQAK